MRTSPAHRAAGPRNRRRRGAVLATLMTALAVALVGSANATHSTTDTTAVAFVPVPAKKVMSANSIPAGATESAIVIGGTTTVPSNATTVRLKVTVKGAAAGTITLFPAGNEAGGAGHTVSWAAGATVTETEAENVGLSNKVSVKNSSTKAAVVTLEITGYSTQVTAGDINGSGGSKGDALVNSGAGAVWGTPGRAFAGQGPASQPIAFNSAVMAAVTVPAGAYIVRFNGTVFGTSATPDFAHCWLVTTSGFAIAFSDAAVHQSVQRSTVSVQGLTTTAAGGQLTARCWSQQGQPMSMFNATLIAEKVGEVNGAVSSGARQVAPPTR